MDLSKKSPKVRRWTRTAVECYNRGCVCEGCYYKDFFKEDRNMNYFQKCQMKKTVLELVRTIGKPDKYNIITTKGTEEILKEEEEENSWIEEII